MTGASPTVKAWLDAMGVRDDGWPTYVRHFDEMPPDVQAAWGANFAVKERATLARIRERRRMYAAHTPAMSAEAQRIARPGLWQVLVASAEGEQEDDDDEAEGKDSESGHDGVPTSQPIEPADGPLSTHGQLRHLHTKYLAEIDNAPPPLVDAPPNLVDMFRRTLHAKFVKGELDMPPETYMCDFDEQWDDPRVRRDMDDCDAWLESDD